MTEKRFPSGNLNDELAPGIYELLSTDSLRNRISAEGHIEPAYDALPTGEDPTILSRHLASIIHQQLVDMPEKSRVEWANGILAHIGPQGVDRIFEQDFKAFQLVELRERDALRRERMARPSTLLSDAALLTNARDEPGLGSELRAEIASSDEVDLLCAFVKWHGLRVLEKELRDFHDHGGKLRVITTTYMGATEQRALDRLVRDFGAEVRINYETKATRLHAKAWLFRRHSGFNTAYVGSSNLSRSALLDGLEWNVRLSSVGTPALMRKFDATFTSYWADESFKTYDPTTDAVLLKRELTRGRAYETNETVELSGLEIRPFPHQEEILAALDAERIVHGRHRNLVVAATGTGKTLVAAMDYRELSRKMGRRPRLLFVAHRKEILAQARRAYREVLGDPAFGETYVDGQRPTEWNHVFASVQSLSSYGIENLPPHHFEVVVVDEFHHAEAKTYRRLLEHLEPTELLGLTATPERNDGVDVREFFGGRIAAELRLWDALEADLLVPFHYFGVADDTDLTGITWRRGAYDISELENVYTGNEARVRVVLRELESKTDVNSMKSLGFCVSVAHAKFMSERFNRAGIPSTYITGGTASAERAAALRQLREGSLKCVFAVDVFNEGVDIPEIDTILMLRPTESSTIFIQQLGRGLRRSYGKSVLTVLDFIGNQNAEYRFDSRFLALTGAGGRMKLIRDVQQGFPFLPSGSQIVLDRVAKDIVLESIKARLGYTINHLVSDIRAHAGSREPADYLLRDFLAESGRELIDVYKNHSWTTLLRRTFQSRITPRRSESSESEKQEAELLKKVTSFLHVDDPERVDAYSRLLEPGGASYEALSPRDQTYARMLFFLLWPDGKNFTSFSQGLDYIREFRDVVSELRQVMDIALDVSREVPVSLEGHLGKVPLFSHVRYRREEILAAVDYANLERRASGHQSGVVWSPSLQTDAFLINLHKSEKDFSPNTMYRDYAISKDLFHWESQSTTSLSSPTGKRYLNQRGNTEVLLFVRDSPTDSNGATLPFMLLGQADLVEHSGEKPIAITWKLRRNMPPVMYIRASAVAR